MQIVKANAGSACRTDDRASPSSEGVKGKSPAPPHYRLIALHDGGSTFSGAAGPPAGAAGARLTARSDEALFVSREVCRGTVDQGAGWTRGASGWGFAAAAASAVEASLVRSHSCRVPAKAFGTLPPHGTAPSVVLISLRIAPRCSPVRPRRWAHTKEAEADRVARPPGAPPSRHHQPNIFSG